MRTYTNQFCLSLYSSGVGKNTNSPSWSFLHVEEHSLDILPSPDAFSLSSAHGRRRGSPHGEFRRGPRHTWLAIFPFLMENLPRFLARYFGAISNCWKMAEFPVPFWALAQCQVAEMNGPKLRPSNADLQAKKGANLLDFIFSALDSLGSWPPYGLTLALDC